MDNQELVNVPTVESRFANPNIISGPHGDFTIFEGLPKEKYIEGTGIFGVPQKPHIIKADNFELTTTGGKTVFQTKNVNVLYMHGEIKNGTWVPKDPEVNLAVAEIISAYEKFTLKNIDAIFVCNYENNQSSQDVDPVDDKPRIYAKKGKAAGLVVFDTKTGKINIRMDATKDNDLEYMAWQDANLKLSPRSA